MLRREAFVAVIRTNAAGEVVQIGKRMQAQRLVADPHPVGIETHVLQRGLPGR